MTVTLQEEFVLPSKGMIYGKQFDPRVKLRSMTVAEEMKRLSPSSTPYKTMSEIIDDCLLTKLPISVYDLCMGDYIYLLQKLRIITYGSDYKFNYFCPKCMTEQSVVFDLNTLNTKEYDEKEVEELSTVTLSSGKVVKLRFQTPRDLDNIELKAAEMKKEFPDMTGNPTVLLTLQSFIDTIDGKRPNQALIQEELKLLPAADYNLVVQAATKLNEKVGVDTTATVQCNSCKNSVTTMFRYTNEFFRPTIY